MVNDTTTLNGALSELGETLATNITAKGVSASPSDGLTTLANKVLQITGGGGSTIIFEDKCDSASGLTNYGNIVSLENNTSATLTYDSTENAYSIACTGSGVKIFPITDLNGLDSFKLTMELKMPSRSGVCGGIACINATEHTGVGGVIERNSGLGSNVHFFENDAWKSNDSTTFSTSDYTNYYKLEMTVNGYDVTWKWYDYQDNLLRTVNKTLNTMSTDFTTLSERGYGLDIGWSSNSSYPVFVKNIKAESLGGGSDCSQYQTEISNAIEYINGSGS